MTSHPSPFAVIAGALGLFLVVFALLAFQLRAHARPALAAGPQPVRRVLQRRIVIRKVIVTVRSAAGSAAAGPARVVQSAPAVSGPAAPAPAPAPAPAAPLVSATS